MAGVHRRGRGESGESPHRLHDRREVGQRPPSESRTAGEERVTGEHVPVDVKRYAARGVSGRVQNLDGQWPHGEHLAVDDVFVHASIPQRPAGPQRVSGGEQVGGGGAGVPVPESVERGEFVRPHRTVPGMGEHRRAERGDPDQSQDVVPVRVGERNRDDVEVGDGGAYPVGVVSGIDDECSPVAFGVQHPAVRGAARSTVCG